MPAGVSSSGKTRVFGTRIRRFESSHPSQHSQVKPTFFFGSLPSVLLPFLTSWIGLLIVSVFSQKRIVSEVIHGLQAFADKRKPKG